MKPATPLCPRHDSPMELVPMKIPLFSLVGYNDKRERSVWKCTREGCKFYGSAVYSAAPITVDLTGI
jgi:hypothetical protein